MRYVEADLRKMAEAVVDRARRVCIANSVRFFDLKLRSQQRTTTDCIASIDEQGAV
jgi:hypothetical protein